MRAIKTIAGSIADQRYVISIQFVQYVKLDMEPIPHETLFWLQVLVGATTELPNLSQLCTGTKAGTQTTTSCKPSSSGVFSKLWSHVCHRAFQSVSLQ